MLWHPILITIMTDVTIGLLKVNPRRVLKIECHGFHWLLKDILEFTNVPEGHSGYLGLTLQRPNQKGIKRIRRYSAVFLVIIVTNITIGLWRVNTYNHISIITKRKRNSQISQTWPNKNKAHLYCIFWLWDNKTKECKKNTARKRRILSYNCDICLNWSL